MPNQKSSAIVITATVGHVDLENAMNSVRNQSYSDILHLIVIDGEQFHSSVVKIISKVPSYNYKTITIPWNTGANKFNGHRIFAALGFLIDHQYVFFLDDDNWFHKDHVSSLINCIEKNQLDWAYSLRKIYSENKDFICLDNCESIGDWTPFSGLGNLVDTSCYCLKKEVLMKTGYSWMERYFGDRTFFNAVKQSYPKYQTTALHTLNYKLSDNTPPNADFFLRGNRFMLTKFDRNLPWLDV